MIISPLKGIITEKVFDDIKPNTMAWVLMKDSNENVLAISSNTTIYFYNIHNWSEVAKTDELIKNENNDELGKCLFCSQCGFYWYCTIHIVGLLIIFYINEVYIVFMYHYILYIYIYIYLHSFFNFYYYSLCCSYPSYRLH